MSEPAFDLVIRNARVATAADTFHADIGIKAGIIVQLGLDIAAGTAVRFEPGQTRDVTLVPYRGIRAVYGFRGDVMGALD